MTEKIDIKWGQYTPVEYRQFQNNGSIRVIRTVFGILTWPVIVPLALLARVSDDVFRSISEALSQAPFLIGLVVRAEFYRWSLRKCGRNVLIEFGTVFLYRDVAVGSNVSIGRYTIIHHCDIGDYALVGEGTSLLSGSKYH